MQGDNKVSMTDGALTDEAHRIMNTQIQKILDKKQKTAAKATKSCSSCKRKK